MGKQFELNMIKEITIAIDNPTVRIPAEFLKEEKKDKRKKKTILIMSMNEDPARKSYIEFRKK